ncbi:MAG: adenosine-specific kinase, partial [Desulfurococcaceae archaeon]
MNNELKINIVDIVIPEKSNVIIGRSHFIKTIEDIYEALVTSVPGIKFGLAFNEASGKRLVRWDGNDDELIKQAIDSALKIGAGHV